MALPLLIIAGISAGYSMRMQQLSADVQEAEILRQRDQEKIAAEGRELERRQQLNKVLSANIVSQSISGMTGEGTPESIALESAKQASLSEAMEGLSDRLRQANLERQARNVQLGARAQMASTLLQSATSMRQVS